MFKIYNDNCLNVLKSIPDNSIPLICVDPPYGLSKHEREDTRKCLEAWEKGEAFVHSKKGFMSRDWDGWVIGPEVWKECYRVLTPDGILASFAGTRTLDLMMKAIEMGGFKVQDVKLYCFGCYSEDTEILTQTGWKKYKDFLKEDKILQWCPETNILTWYLPVEKFEYQINEEMVLLENRHTSQLVTQNHSVWAKVKKYSRDEISDVFERFDASSLKKTWCVNLPLAGTMKGIKKEENAYLIGWWLTDAWPHKDGKACMFSQSKPQTLLKLRTHFDQKGIIYSEYVKPPKKETHKEEHTFYVTGNYADFLIKNYPKRELTWDVLEFDSESRNELLEGLLDGDGTRTRDGGYSEVFWSKKNERLDIVQALCLSLNIRSHIDYKKGCLYLNRARNTTELQQKHKTPLQKYKGMVWCLKTETGAFVVRRNGKAFISGNSGFPKSLNVKKSVEKMGINISKEELEKISGYGSALKPAFEPIIIASKTGSVKIDPTPLFYCSKASKKDRNEGCEGVIIWENVDLDQEVQQATSLRKDMLEGFSQISEGKEWNMMLFGSKISEKFQKDLTFIIGTILKPTTESKTLNYYPSSITKENILDVIKTIEGNGLSLAESVESLSQLILNFTNEKMELVLGVVVALLKMLMKIKEKGKIGNSHATVKGTKLMEWLVPMLSKEGDTVLDVFMGSGSTGKACIKNKRNFIGCDLSADYCEIAQARLNYEEKKALVPQTEQMELELEETEEGETL